MNVIDWLLNNFVALLTLIIALLTLWVSVKTYKYSKKQSKENIRREIAVKKAQLEAINSIHYGLDHTTVSNMMVEKAKLNSEIEILKKKL